MPVRRRPPLSILGALIWALSVFTTLAVAIKANPRDFTTLSAGDMSEIVSQHDPHKALDTSNPSSHLSKILIPRPCKYSPPPLPPTSTLTRITAGSVNNTIVRDYIVKTLMNLDWHIDEDTFEDDTPYGRKIFTNIIATYDPQASRRLVMSAHFDSKFFSAYPENQVRFIRRDWDGGG